MASRSTSPDHASGSIRPSCLPTIATTDVSPSANSSRGQRYGRCTETLKAGILGSHDSITGAPEKFKGEAAEQEASNLVASVASVTVGSAVGKRDQGVPDDAPFEDDVPDAMDIVANTADAQRAAHGGVPTRRFMTKHDNPCDRASWMLRTLLCKSWVISRIPMRN